MIDESVENAGMNAFLASVEKQAYVMAKFSTGNSDAALDIVQDAMLGMLRNYRNRPSEQWKPLFFKVLNNRINDHHRKRGFSRLIRWFGDSTEAETESVDAIEQLPTDLESPEEHHSNRELGEALQKALAQLPVRQREAFLLRLWQGFSVEEAAIAMGVSQGSVKTHLSRALQKMQACLQGYHSMDGDQVPLPQQQSDGSGGRARRRASSDLGAAVFVRAAAEL